MNSMEPWLNGEYYDCLIGSPDSDWYLEAFAYFKKKGEALQYSGTYELLNE